MRCECIPLDGVEFLRVRIDDVRAGHVGVGLLTSATLILVVLFALALPHLGEEDVVEAEHCVGVLSAGDPLDSAGTLAVFVLQGKVTICTIDVTKTLILRLILRLIFGCLTLILQMQ